MNRGHILPKVGGDGSRSVRSCRLPRASISVDPYIAFRGAERGPQVLDEFPRTIACRLVGIGMSQRPEAGRHAEIDAPGVVGSDEDRIVVLGLPHPRCHIRAVVSRF